MGEIVLVRHGETAWSREGRHTGRTDVPLTARGRGEAEAVGRALQGRRFALVLTSPLGRAVETCRIAGFADVAQPRSDLLEWDYGIYEGVTSDEIRRDQPGWTVWDGELPGGESLDEVAARTDRVLTELRGADGDVLVFSHGHLLRILAARWLGQDPHTGRLLALDPATLSVLGHEHGQPVLRAWNAASLPTP